MRCTLQEAHEDPWARYATTVYAVGRIRFTGRTDDPIRWRLNVNEPARWITSCGNQLVTTPWRRAGISHDCNRKKINDGPIFPDRVATEDDGSVTPKEKGGRTRWAPSCELVGQCRPPSSAGKIRGAPLSIGIRGPYLIEFQFPDFASSKWSFASVPLPLKTAGKSGMEL